jgi:O-acetyl-ADP-ribose deacetylase (regulator of RNase III)
LAEKYNLVSISFPSISTVIYGYTVSQAAEVALKAVADFLRSEASSVKQVMFVLWDDKTVTVYEEALSLILDIS